MSNVGEMNLGLESVKGLSAKLIQAVLGFVGTILFARILGPTEFGGFYFLLTLVILLNRPLRGLGNAGRKRYSEANSQPREILGSILLIDTVVFSIVGVCAFVLGDWLYRITNVENAGIVFFALFVSLGVFYPFQNFLAAEGWISKQVWNDTLRSVLTTGFQLVFVLAGFGAAGMGYGLSIASLGVVPTAWYFLRIVPEYPSRETLQSLWDFAKYSMPNAIVGKVYNSVDTLLIGGIITTAAVGHYQAADKLTVVSAFVTSTLGGGFMAKISNKYSKDEPIAQDIVNTTSYVSILAIPIFFGGLALSRELLVTAYGPEYSEGAVLLPGLALYKLVQSQSTIHTQSLNGIDRPDLSLRIDAVTLAVNIVIGLVLVLVFGLGPFGVVLGSILAAILRYLLTSASLRRRIDGIELIPRPFAEQVLSGAVMFLLVETLSRTVRIRSWTVLILVVGVGAVVYGLVLLVVSTHFRLTIRSIWSDATS